MTHCDDSAEPNPGDHNYEILDENNRPVGAARVYSIGDASETHGYGGRREVRRTAEYFEVEVIYLIPGRDSPRRFCEVIGDREAAIGWFNADGNPYPVRDGGDFAFSLRSARPCETERWFTLD